MAEASRPVYPEDTTFVISPPSCHPSQNSYRKSELKLLKTFCHTCKSQCEGIDVLKHLFFGIIQCKGCFEIRACNQFTRYFPMTTKCLANKDGHVLVWKELPVGYVMQHTRAEMTKKSTSVLATQEVADVASRYVQTLLSLRELEPWKAAISHMIKEPLSLKISDLPPPLQPCRITRGRTSEEEKVPPAKRRALYRTPAVPKTKTKPDGKETSVASQSPSNSLMEFVPSPYSRTLYHEVTTPVISQPSCHPSQNSYRKAQLKLLKTFCYTCKSQCEGIDVLKHLFFGIIQCKCHFDIRACCQFTQYFPMTTKCPANKDGHVLVWKELPVGYVMQHTRAEMAKKSTSVPTSEEVADVASHYVRTLMSLRELEPWKAAISYMVKNPVLLKISDLPPPMQLCRVTMGQTSEKVPPAKRRGILQAPAVAVMKAGAEGTKPRTRYSSCAAIRAFRNSGIKSIKAETPPFQTTFAPKSQSSSASLPTIPGEVTVFSAKTNTHTAPDRTHATPVKTSTHTSPAKTRTTPARTSTHTSPARNHSTPVKKSTHTSPAKTRTTPARTSTHTSPAKTRTTPARTSTHTSPARNHSTPVKTSTHTSPARTYTTPVKTSIHTSPDRTHSTPVKTSTHTSPDRTHSTPVKTSTHTSPAKTRTTPARTSTHTSLARTCTTPARTSTHTSPARNHFTPVKTSTYTSPARNHSTPVKTSTHTSPARTHSTPVKTSTHTSPARTCSTPAKTSTHTSPARTHSTRAEAETHTPPAKKATHFTSTTINTYTSPSRTQFTPTTTDINITPSTINIEVFPDEVRVFFAKSYTSSVKKVPYRAQSKYVSSERQSFLSMTCASPSSRKRSTTSKPASSTRRATTTLPRSRNRSKRHMSRTSPQENLQFPPRPQYIPADVFASGHYLELKWNQPFPEECPQCYCTTFTHKSIFLNTSIVKLKCWECNLHIYVHPHPDKHILFLAQKEKEKAALPKFIDNNFKMWPVNLGPQD